jgi:hypothetical protein
MERTAGSFTPRAGRTSFYLAQAVLRVTYGYLRCAAADDRTTITNAPTVVRMTNQTATAGQLAGPFPIGKRCRQAEPCLVLTDGPPQRAWHLICPAVRDASGPGRLADHIVRTVSTFVGTQNPPYLRVALNLHRGVIHHWHLNRVNRRHCLLPLLPVGYGF